MTIKVNASLLADLCAPHFTYDACQAIIDDIDSCCGDEAGFMVGDIIISYCEVPTEDVIEYPEDYPEDIIVAILSNGNTLIRH